MITENPFASTLSLDKNPFEDPASKHSAQYATKMEELNRRERDLEQREQALDQRAEHIRLHGRNNWPLFFPVIYHSITDEIPEKSRTTVRNLYWSWFALVATLAVNLVACAFLLTTASSDGGKDLAASIGYFPMITVLSFALWYRPVYNGFMKDQSMYFYLYFFFGGWHMLFSIYMLVGIPSTGSAGLIQTIGLFARHHIVGGVFAAIATAGWGIQSLVSAFYLFSIWRFHNRPGHTFAKAKGEFTRFGIKSYFSRDTFVSQEKF